MADKSRLPNSVKALIEDARRDDPSFYDEPFFYAGRRHGKDPHRAVTEVIPKNGNGHRGNDNGNGNGNGAGPTGTDADTDSP